MSYNFSGYYINTPDYKTVAEIFKKVLKENGAEVKELSEYERGCVAITGFKAGYTTVVECISSRLLTDRFSEALQTDAYTYATYETVGLKCLYARKHNIKDSVLISYGEDYFGDIDLVRLVEAAKQDPNYKMMPNSTLKDFELESIYLYSKYVLKIDIENILLNSIVPEHDSQGKYIDTPLYFQVDFPKSLKGFGHTPGALQSAFPEKFRSEKNTTTPSVSTQGQRAPARLSLTRIVWTILRKLIGG